MNTQGQSLYLGLAQMPPANARRVLLFRLMLANAAELRRCMDQQLASQGLTTQQAMLLYMVEAQAEPPTLTGLAQLLAMSHQNLKQIAQALVRKGFLEIRQDPADARTRRLHLTEQHYRFWAERNPADHASVAAWTAGLSDAAVDQTVVHLEQLHQQLMQQRGGR